MELIYCHRCRMLILPGSLQRTRRHAVSDEAICDKCFRLLSAEQRGQYEAIEDEPAPTAGAGEEPVDAQPSAAEERPSEEISAGSSAPGRRRRLLLFLALPAMAAGIAAAAAVLFADDHREPGPQLPPPEASREGGREQTSSAPGGQPPPARSPLDSAPTLPAPAPEPAPPSAVKAALRRQYAEAEEYWRGHPEDYAAALERFRRISGQAADSSLRQMAEDAIGQILAAREASAEAILAEIRDEADESANRSDFDRALAILTRDPPRLGELLQPRLKAERAAMSQRAEAALAEIMAAAEKLSGEGMPKEAMEALAKADGVAYAAGAQKLAAMRERLLKESADLATAAEKQRKLAAARKLDGILQDFEDMLLAGAPQSALEGLSARRGGLSAYERESAAGSLDAARALGEALAAEQTLRARTMAGLVGKPVQAHLADGRLLSGTLRRTTSNSMTLEVSFNVGSGSAQMEQEVPFSQLAPGELLVLAPPSKPTTPEMHLAATVMRLSTDDLGGAEKALAGAASHPLASRWADRIEQTRRASREGAAARAWETSVARMLRKNYSENDSRNLAKALQSFLDAHGDSHFARDRHAEIVALRAAAAGLESQVRRLFKGKLVGLDVKTLDVEISWDFSSPVQLEDFLRSGPVAATGRLDLPAGRRVSLPCVFESIAKASCIGEVPEGGQLCLEAALHGVATLSLQREANKAAVRGAAIQPPLPAAELPARACALEWAMADGRLSARAGNLDLQVPAGLKPRLASFSVRAGAKDASVTELRISGRLYRPWLELALLRNRTRAENLLYAQWPFDAAEARRRQAETAAKLGVPVEETLPLGGDDRLEMVLIPAGEFIMGEALPVEEVARLAGSPDKATRWQAAYPVHRVTITRPFYLSRREVTQAQWARLMGTNPAQSKDGRNPVESVNWAQCQSFCAKMTYLSVGRFRFRLPTEAEWEHACRSGSEAPFFFGSVIDAEKANYDGTQAWDGRQSRARGGTTPAGSLPANAWGLQDMAGNVFERCADVFAPYEARPASDPSRWGSGPLHAVRGGAYDSHPAECRSADRRPIAPEAAEPTVGLRVMAEIRMLPLR